MTPSDPISRLSKHIANLQHQLRQEQTKADEWRHRHERLLGDILGLSDQIEVDCATGLSFSAKDMVKRLQGIRERNRRKA